ncbi:alpha/beta hydrolase [Nonomuraea sp. NPDC050022]|uniref:alpha/beta hydrolase n=1 Tax=unclassified Nonomuraea TaxID=2593643 RepID=UPI0033DEA5F9
MRIEVSHYEAVHTLIMSPDVPSPLRLVFVFSHGFSVDGTESARHFLDIANRIVEHGAHVVLFDYRGSGYSDGLFEDMTLESEIADLNSILDFVSAHFPGHRVIVWGESLGAAVVAHTLAARSDAFLALMWSLSADLYQRYNYRFGKEIDEQGYTYTDNGLKVKRIFLDSLKNRDTYAAIKSMHIPCLLVHGNADPVASIDLSRTAHRIASENTTLMEIRDGNHGFEGQPQQFSEALHLSLEWVFARV